VSEEEDSSPPPPAPVEEEVDAAPPPPAPLHYQSGDAYTHAHTTPPPPGTQPPQPTAAQLPSAVKQGWIHSKEPSGKKLWFRRWGVVSHGQLEMFEDQSARNLMLSVPLKECRVEKMKVRDGHLQKDCDYDYAIRLVLGKRGGIMAKNNMRFLAGETEVARSEWGGALMSCRLGKLEVYPTTYETPAAASAAAAVAKGLMHSAGKALVDGMMMETSDLMSQTNPGAPTIPMGDHTDYLGMGGGGSNEAPPPPPPPFFLPPTNVQTQSAGAPPIPPPPPPNMPNYSTQPMSPWAAAVSSEF